MPAAYRYLLSLALIRRPHPLDLLQHRLPGGGCDPLDVLHRQFIRLDRLQDLAHSALATIHPSLSLAADTYPHPDSTRLKSPILKMQHMGVILDDDGDDRHTGLDSQMERSLFERQQVRLAEVRTCALGKDPDALLVPLDLVNGAVECRDGGFPVASVDEDGSAQGHCLGYQPRSHVSHRHRRNGGKPTKPP